MKFKVGDRVQLVKDHELGLKKGMKGTIVETELGGRPYGIEFDMYFNGHDLNGKCKYGHGLWVKEGHITKVSKTLEDLEVGDVVINESGTKRTILGICGKIFHLSCNDDAEYFWMSYSLQELKADGYKPANQEPERETIEIDGKKYYKDEVVKRVKKLEPIE